MTEGLRRYTTILLSFSFVRHEEVQSYAYNRL